MVYGILLGLCVQCGIAVYTAGFMCTVWYCGVRYTAGFMCTVCGVHCRVDVHSVVLRCTLSG